MRKCVLSQPPPVSRHVGQVLVELDARIRLGLPGVDGVVVDSASPHAAGEALAHQAQADQELRRKQKIGVMYSSCRKRREQQRNAGCKNGFILAE